MPTRNHFLGLALIAAGFFLPAFTVFNWSTPDSVPIGGYLSDSTLYLSLFSILFLSATDAATHVSTDRFSIISVTPGDIKYVPFALIAAGFIVLFVAPRK